MIAAPARPTPPMPMPAIGALVRARGRDWVVLPPRESDVLRLRPLTSTGADPEDEVAGLFWPLEGASITQSAFPLPDPAFAGDATGGSVLRDAARLSLRHAAAPFRGLSRVAVSPRPYQLVPLVMALRLEPVRLLIADDVGVGKTVEAALIARELLDRGLIRRVGVLCPAHLCEQWETELRDKVGISAAVVQPSRVARLERDLPRADLSLYQHYQHLVCSIDYVKGDRVRGMFLDNAPDFVIVDEAHVAARPRGDADGQQQQRHALARALADQPERHLVLVTATPHSGIEESFRSLLGLLDRRFDLPPERELDRAQLLPYLVQRRRADLARWLGTETPFPERRSEERTYALSPAYHRLFDDVLAYCRETVRSPVGSGLAARQQRVRHWAAIALVRCVLSSPAAAEAVLAAHARRRGLERASSGPDEAATLATIDDQYRPQVLDPLDDEQAGDYVPAAPLEDADALLSDADRRRMAAFLRAARALAGPDGDLKLAECGHVVGELLRDGFRPIVFCRFIPTARYLETWLPKLLGRDHPGVRVVAVTGEVGDEERRERVEAIGRDPVRVLVATDCLSEGINLQEDFDAVVHYDLPWNPNRLEQREGRVDRFGQRAPVVHASLLYGADNPVDLVVRDVLIRKARAIRQQLGVSVPVGESEQVLQAVVDSVLLHGSSPGQGLQMRLDLADPKVSRLHAAWDQAAAREHRQRAYFAQHGIRPEEVAEELAAADPVLGDAAAVRRFLANAAQRFGGGLLDTSTPGVADLAPGDVHERLAALGYQDRPLRVAFDQTLDPTALDLGRTHPLVAAFCEAVLGAALAETPDVRFARCGAVATGAVARRTAVLLLRLRYLLSEREGSEEFAEEVVLAAGERRDGALAWLDLDEDAAADLLARAQPVAALGTEQRSEQVRWALELVTATPEWWAPVVARRVAALEASHHRLRRLVHGGRVRRLRVDPRTPPDILGCYVLVPAAAGGGR